MRLSSMTVLLALLVLLVATETLCFVDPNYFYVHKTAEMTFRRNKPTVARKKYAVPQLICYGEACPYFQPEEVSCKREDIPDMWRCSTFMKKYFRFNRLEVGCEGFSDDNDPWVLEGSCHLKYELVLTEEGKKHFNPYALYQTNTNERSLLALAFFTVSIFFFVVAMLLCFGVTEHVDKIN